MVELIEGMLIVNLDPPYIGFTQSKPVELSERPFKMSVPCSADDIRRLLLNLDVIDQFQNWPPRECVLLLQSSLPVAALHASSDKAEGRIVEQIALRRGS